MTHPEESISVGLLGRILSNRTCRLITDQVAPDIDSSTRRKISCNNTVDRPKATSTGPSRCRKRAKKKKKTTLMNKYCVSEEESDDVSE